MYIFCTNDDGVSSHGTAVLANQLQDIATDVRIGAPHCNMSGAGTSILVPGSSDRTIRLRPHKYESHPHLDAHSVSGTPALTVFLAHRGHFGRTPDVVVSGPNLGANVGLDIQHSGTVGAAMAAVRHGTHGVAVSLAVGIGGGDHTPQWETAAALTTALVVAIAELRLTQPVLLNLNVPNRPIEKVQGVRSARLAPGSTYRIRNFEETLDTDGVRVLAPALEMDDTPHGAETDIGILREGAATLTWLTLPGCTDPVVEHLQDIVAAVNITL